MDLTAASTLSAPDADPRALLRDVVDCAGTEDVDPDARALDVLNPTSDHAAHGGLRS